MTEQGLTELTQTTRDIVFEEGCGRGKKLNRARTFFKEEAPGAAVKN